MLVHGGMAQNVGPILEMVTEKYLLRSEAEWNARQRGHAASFDEILQALQAGDVAAIGAAHRRSNFDGPMQTIIPWASNLYTETLIEARGKRSGDDFWGFWMLGGMSGGGMGFIFEPEEAEAQDWLQSMHAGRKRSSNTPFRSRWTPLSTTSRSTNAAHSRSSCTGTIRDSA